MTRRTAVLAMLAAVLIYGTNFAFSRHGTLNGLTPHDIAALRFGTAGLLLLPFFLKAGLRSCAGVGWMRGSVLAITSGAPMVILMNMGLSLAPAAHGASIQPGTVTVVGAIGSMILFGTAPTRVVLAGIAIVIAGLAFIGIAGTTAGSPGVVQGDLLFLAAGLLWGVYPLLLQRWGVNGITSAAVVSVLSLAFLPIYALFLEPRIFQADASVVLFQALNQGILNSVVGLWLWGGAVAVLGASVAQRFPPLIPVIGTVAAIPILGEWPGPLQVSGVALIVGGLLLAAFGGRLFGRPLLPKAPLKPGLTTTT